MSDTPFAAPTKPIYVDYAATTPVAPEVVQEMIRYLSVEGDFGNPASTHSYGKAALHAVQHAREQVATLLNASPQEMIWTSGATEANNLAIRGIAHAYASRGRHLITVKTEHASVLRTYEALAKQGFQITLLDVESNGRLNIAELKKALRPDTILVSVMHVNNELGVIQDIAEISNIVHTQQTFLHVDAVQSVGKIPVDVVALGVDLLSVSAHKLYGPKGIGALYIRQTTPRIRLTPLITGGNQEAGVRSGTLPVSQIVGMGKAFELARQQLAHEPARLAALCQTLYRSLAGLEGIFRNGDPCHSAPHILNISIAGIVGEALSSSMPEIACARGAACSAAHFNTSSVLSAIGVGQQRALNTLRLSVGRYTTEAEIQRIADILKKTIIQLRQVSLPQQPVFLENEPTGKVSVK